MTVELPSSRGYNVIQMNFLKAFGLAVLGVLLFLSLSFFGLMFTIDQTFLNPDFTVSQVEKLDTASLAKDIVRGQIVSQATIPITLPIEEFFVGAVDETITDLEPWLKQQTREVTYSFYDYLEGKSQNLSVVIPLESVKESLKDNISKAVIASPPPGLTDLPPDTIERYLEPFYGRIPSSFELNEAWLGPQNMAQIDQLRQIVSHFDIVYYSLIGFILFLILCIILINREVRGSTRSLGATFLSCGIVSYGSVWLAKNAIGTQSALPQVPVYLQSWLPRLMADILSPLGLYSFVLAGMGVVLLVVSFVYRRQAECRSHGVSPVMSTSP
jgi:hypothetical protein